jgi:hypothetical protein
MRFRLLSKGNPEKESIFTKNTDGKSFIKNEVEMSEFIEMELSCHVCGKKFKRKINKSRIRKNGKFEALAYCKTHSIQKTREYRGRTMEEMEKISKKALPEVKILSKEEISKIEHTLTPPSSKKQKYIWVYEKK